MKKLIKTKLRENLINNSNLDNENNRFSVDDIHACWNDYPIERLVDILNGDYKLDEARDDLRSLIGTKYDLRKGQ